MDAIQTVAKMAARKYQAERARSPLLEPKNTIAPDRNVNTDTVVSKITINCIYLLLYHYITNLICLSRLDIIIKIITGITDCSGDF